MTVVVYTRSFRLALTKGISAKITVESFPLRETNLRSISTDQLLPAPTESLVESGK